MRGTSLVNARTVVSHAPLIHSGLTTQALDNAAPANGLPVQIIGVNDDGTLVELFERYPREILMRASNTLASWLQQPNGTTVRRLYIKYSRVPLPAISWILGWLHKFNGRPVIHGNPQLSLEDWEPLDQLTGYYKAITYFDLTGPFKNQHVLRQRIWDHLGSPFVDGEDVVLMWTRLPNETQMIQRCLHTFVDNTDRKSSQTGEDMWAGVKTYFSVYQGLYDEICKIRQRKAHRLDCERTATETSRRDDDVHSLVSRVSRVSVSGAAYRTSTKK